MRRVRVALERFRRSKIALVIVLALVPAAPLAALFSALGCARIHDARYSDLEQRCEYRWVSLYAIGEIRDKPLLMPVGRAIQLHNDTLQVLVSVVCHRG